MKIDIIKTIVKLFLPNKTNKNKIIIEKINTILIISNTAIGDTLFATPAIRTLKKKYPNKRIIALLNPKNGQLFENNKYIDKIYTYNGKWSKFLNIVLLLKKENIDISLVFHSNEPQATPLAYLIGSKYIIKFPNNQNEFNYLHYNNIEEPCFEHATMTRLRQLNYLDITEFNNQSMELFLKEEWKEEVLKFFSKYRIKEKTIGIQVGASTVSRMWFANSWVELITRILKYDTKTTIVLTGSPDEKKLVNDVYKEFENNQNVINASGKLSLGAAATLIGKFKLFITPDTGPLHIAASQNVNTIGLFVVGQAWSTNPISADSNTKHLYIQKDKICIPCKDKRCKYQECMLQITVDEVFDTIKKIRIFNND